MNEPLTWTALEHEQIERHPDWFWTVGIVALGGAIIALILGNVLFALFIVVGAITLSLYAIKHPQEIVFQITSKGLVIDTNLYPYTTLESFCIHEHHNSFRLLVKSQKIFMPYILIPLNDVPPEAVRMAIGNNLPEVYVAESVSEKILEALGI